jgi:hypothetical protein
MVFFINFEPEFAKQEISVSESKALTCGWLLSEVIRIYEDL